MAKIKVELHYYPQEEESYAWQHRKLGERVEGGTLFLISGELPIDKTGKVSQAIQGDMKG